MKLEVVDSASRFESLNVKLQLVWLWWTGLFVVAQSKKLCRIVVDESSNDCAQLQVTLKM